jgi:hypothetical protein
LWIDLEKAITIKKIADYEGNSLIMLPKIAIALNQKLTLNLVPLEDNPSKEPISCWKSC